MATGCNNYILCGSYEPSCIIIIYLNSVIDFNWIHCRISNIYSPRTSDVIVLRSSMGKQNNYVTFLVRLPLFFFVDFLSLYLTLQKFDFDIYIC